MAVTFITYNMRETYPYSLTSFTGFLWSWIRIRIMNTDSNPEGQRKQVRIGNTAIMFTTGTCIVQFILLILYRHIQWILLSYYVMLIVRPHTENWDERTWLWPFKSTMPLPYPPPPPPTPPTCFVMTEGGGGGEEQSLYIVVIHNLPQIQQYFPV